MEETNVPNMGISKPLSVKNLVPPTRKQPSGEIALPILSSSNIQDDKPAVKTYLDLDVPVERNTFPNQPRPGMHLVPSTIFNFRHLLQSYGITAFYNVITKKTVIRIPGYIGSPDNADEVALSHIYSIANLNNIPVGQIQNFVSLIADANLSNPVAEWIGSRAWDGVDRLKVFYDTLQEDVDYPSELKQVLMYRWLISAVAAAFHPQGFKSRGVLTLQGPQSIGKTAWVSALVSDPILRESLVKLDHHLDAGNKDSTLTAISHWIVEIGELDSSFKKDVPRLKGFLTSDRDKIRRPYGRTDSEYARKTVFCASVNAGDFLVDATGSSRFWTIPVTKINYQHGIDMQQLFAQVLLDYRAGEVWWLSHLEEELLESLNKRHRTTSLIRDQVLEMVDFERNNESGLPAFTASELLFELGILRPTNFQARECGEVLREYVGQPKKIQGNYKWRVALRNKPTHDTRY